MIPSRPPASVIHSFVAKSLQRAVRTCPSLRCGSSVVYCHYRCLTASAEYTYVRAIRLALPGLNLLHGGVKKSDRKINRHQ